MSSSSSPASSRQIRKVAVLGAGTMGSRIAAHLTNAGLPVVLLDIVPPGITPEASKTERNKFVLSALDGLKKSKPAAFYVPDSARLLTLGNFDDDLALIADCDWIIEVVAENLDIKHALLAKVQQHRRPGTILTSNTSGIPIHAIAAGLSEEAKPHFFGTHFFNPPRYMRLLEIIPTPDTDPADVAAIAHFCDQRLGKAIVHSHDTPNFIANRIGTFSMMNAVRLMMAQALSVEEVDALTGSALGWPKTATFRLADMVGIDVLAHVSTNFSAQAESIRDERAEVRLPDFIKQMLEKKWLGDKSKQGFYKKEGKDDQGRDLRHVLDWQSLDYKPSARPKFSALEMAKNVESTAARIPQLLHADPRSDKAAAFYWPLLTELFNYSANRVPEIADSIVEIDTAMKTGFNWELGPFEMMDAAGVRATTEKMRSAGAPIAANVEKLLAVGDTWYKDDPPLPPAASTSTPSPPHTSPSRSPQASPHSPSLKSPTA